jgi:hypothetical protein
MDTTAENREAALTILTEKWRQGVWESVAHFRRDTHINLSEFSIGRILVKHRSPSLEAVLHLCYYLCTRDETIKVLKLMGDDIIHKYIEPGNFSQHDDRLLKAFHQLALDRRNLAIQIVEGMVA